MNTLITPWILARTQLLDHLDNCCKFGHLLNHLQSAELPVTAINLLFSSTTPTICITPKYDSSQPELREFCRYLVDILQPQTNLKITFTPIEAGRTYFIRGKFDDLTIDIITSIPTSVPSPFTL